MREQILVLSELLVFQRKSMKLCAVSCSRNGQFKSNVSRVYFCDALQV